MHKFKRLCGIVTFLLIIFGNIIVFAKSETISANDIVGKFSKNWEEKYDPKEATLTREYMNKTLGKNVVDFIDNNYKNIKIKEDDVKKLSKNESVMLLRVTFYKIRRIRRRIERRRI